MNVSDRSKRLMNGQWGALVKPKPLAVNYQRYQRTGIVKANAVIGRGAATASKVQEERWKP